MYSRSNCLGSLVAVPVCLVPPEAENEMTALGFVSCVACLYKRLSGRVVMHMYMYIHYLVFVIVHVYIYMGFVNTAIYT